MHEKWNSVSCPALNGDCPENGKMKYPDTLENLIAGIAAENCFPQNLFMAFLALKLESHRKMAGREPGVFGMSLPE